MIEPVLITTHNQNGTIRHYAWSPHNYDIIVNSHPMIHPDYQQFITRVMNHITEHVEVYGIFYHMHTDFHSTVPMNDRGLTAYFCISFDHVVSPVFFNINVMNNFVINHPQYQTVYISQHLVL